MTTFWRVSHRCAIKHIDCTVRGILGGCGAACCKHMSYWPPKAGTDPAGCDNLGPNGCELGLGRPVTCHLYPFRLNANGTLVLHHTAAYLPHGVCEPCRDKGPRIIDAMRGSLITLFGVEIADSIRADIDAGRDAVFPVPDRILRAMDKEARWESLNIVPTATRW